MIRTVCGAGGGGEAQEENQVLDETPLRCFDSDFIPAVCQLLCENELLCTSSVAAPCPGTRWDSSAGEGAPYLSDDCFMLEPCYLCGVIRRCTEPPYLEEDERRPRVKLTL